MGCLHGDFHRSCLIGKASLSDCVKEGQAYYTLMGITRHTQHAYICARRSEPRLCTNPLHPQVQYEGTNIINNKMSHTSFFVGFSAYRGSYPSLLTEAQHVPIQAVCICQVSDATWSTALQIELCPGEWVGGNRKTFDYLYPGPVSES